jgi:hypothetical protein
VKSIECRIEEELRNLRNQMEERRVLREKEELKMMEEFYKVKQTLIECVKNEKNQREVNKEQLL